VAHPAEVRRLVVMESVIPAFIPTARQGVWWFSFHQTPDVPEAHTDKFIAILCVVSEQNSFPLSEGIYHYVGNPAEQ